MQAEVDMMRMEQARDEMNYSSALLRHLAEELEMAERELAGQSAFGKQCIDLHGIRDDVMGAGRSLIKMSEALNHIEIAYSRAERDIENRFEEGMVLLRKLPLMSKINFSDISIRLDALIGRKDRR